MRPYMGVLSSTNLFEADRPCDHRILSVSNYITSIRPNSKKTSDMQGRRVNRQHALELFGHALRPQTAYARWPKTDTWTLNRSNPV